MKLDNVSTSILIIGLLYWIYLLDPFKSKSQLRIYKKILQNRSFFYTNCILATSLFIIALIRIVIYNKPDMYGLLPLIFIVTIFILNYFSKIINKRDFHLRIQGDMLTTPAFDWVASIIAIVFPLVSSTLISILLIDR